MYRTKIWHGNIQKIRNAFITGVKKIKSVIWKLIGDVINEEHYG
jgi:hypothetical protein